MTMQVGALIHILEIMPKWAPVVITEPGNLRLGEPVTTFSEISDVGVTSDNGAPDTFQVFLVTRPKGGEVL
jgi:hypothetical protein